MVDTRDGRQRNVELQTTLFDATDQQVIMN